MLKNLTLLLILLVAVPGCQKNETAGTTAAAGAEESTEAAKAGLPPGAIGGLVIDTMDSGGYTYVLVDTGSERLWAAGPETEVKIGQEVVMPRSMVMTDFHSKTLDRTFAEIHFVGAIEAAGHTHGTEEAAVSPHASSAMTTTTSSRTRLAKTEIEAVAKIEGGYTVAEIYDRKDELAGQPVAVRGRVVKFTPNIMGTNWVHLQDGTGDDQTADLTVTTESHLETGDLVIVRGALTVDKDFGAGYSYTVIIEDAIVNKE